MSGVARTGARGEPRRRAESLVRWAAVLWSWVTGGALSLAWGWLPERGGERLMLVAVPVSAALLALFAVERTMAYRAARRGAVRLRLLIDLFVAVVAAAGAVATAGSGWALRLVYAAAAYAVVIYLVEVVGVWLRGLRHATIERWSPGRLACGVVGGTVALSAAGTLLLFLPRAWTYDPLGDAPHVAVEHFTRCLLLATSAVSTAGFAVCDIGSELSPFGQAVLAALMQIGGAGFAVAGSLAAARCAIRAAHPNGAPMTDWARAGAHVVRGTVLLLAAFEAVTACVLLAAWRAEAGGASALWPSVFHAISAVCDTGFTLQRGDLGGPTAAWPARVAIMCAVGLVSLGYPVWAVILSQRARGRSGSSRGRTSPVNIPAAWRRYARYTLWASLVLIAGGTALLTFTRNETTSRTGLGAPLFQAIAVRNTGFGASDGAPEAGAARAVLGALMVAGGAAGSAGGGIGPAGVAAIAVCAATAVAGRRRAALIGPEVRRAARWALVTGAAIVLLAGAAAAALRITEGAPGEDAFFEALSAATTTGLTSGLARRVGVEGSVVLAATMVVGRVLPLLTAMHLPVGEPARRGEDHGGGPIM